MHQTLKTQLTELIEQIYHKHVMKAYAQGARLSEPSVPDQVRDDKEACGFLKWS